MTPDIAWAWPWWSAMVTVNIINLIVCLTISRRISRSAGGFSNITDQYQKNMLVMGVDIHHGWSLSRCICFPVFISIRLV